ncbi:unnamed protein product [Ostreobium quekettii]|uniref:Transcription factor 25 n=1 Tax=Ostreobium quekettii TaxID=121088 RepID=A0A8S1J1G0_9CHLO|nr:unnamed protein product [Ostreobium quekettii]
MASRHIRRVRQQREVGLASGPGQDRGSSTDEDAGGSAPPTFNPYQYLATEEEEDEEQATDEGPTGGDDEGPVAPSELTPAAASQTTAGKKKRNRKRGKQKAAGKETGKDKQRGGDRPEEDVDKLVEELKLQTAGCDVDCSTSAPAEASKAHVLAVEAGSLRADEELYRIFGARVVASEEAQLRQERDRRWQRYSKGLRGVRRTVRNFWLVEVQEHWPPLDGGLSMEYRGEESGCYKFCYVYSSQYRQIQDAFEECQASANPNTIAALLNRCPYHVEAGLAMHDLYRAMSEHLSAEELLNRCLYALESAWHPWFNPAYGTCKLSYKIPENRPLFMALFRHVQTLTRQSCLSTALECCKLLLSLDDGDPMGAACMIDYLAIRAGRFEFLQRLVDEGIDASTSLALLPGMAFSVPLSKFLRAQQETAKSLNSKMLPGCAARSKSDNPGVEDNGTKRAVGANAQDNADQSLVDAILLYPVVVVRLLAKLKEKGVGIDKEWTGLLSKNPLSGAGDNSSASLNHLVNIFVERNHLLWKGPRVLAWLKEGCQQAAAACTPGSAPVGTTVPADWCCVRNEAFPPSGTNEYRHLHLYDFSDDVPQLPAEELREAMGGGRDEIHAAMAGVEQRMAEALEQRDNQRGIVQLTEEELRNSNPLLVFLRSLLPWVQPGRQANGDHAHQ